MTYAIGFACLVVGLLAGIAIGMAASASAMDGY